jgi:pimeloyl-ACP methyl ester carboxylesterase
LLVAVHGWLLAGRLWDPLARVLEPDWQLWSPDLPGFGTTPRPRGLQPSLASYGRWLAEAVVAHANNRPVVLVGHSLGGSVVLHAAAQLGPQLKAIVQVASGGGVFQPKAFAQVRWAGSAFLQWRPTWLRSLPYTDSIRSPLGADLRAARGLLACSTNRGAVGQLPQITGGLQVPSLWIAGSRDQVMQSRYVRHLAGYAPDHRIVVLEGLGHLAMRENPQLLATTMGSWLMERLHNQGL